MPPMNRMERLTAIVLLLQERPRNSEEIARTFEVSRRTVLRDVQALSEIGVPIIAREGAGGGYALPDDYALAPLPLTAHEAFLLLLALRPLAQLGQVPFGPARSTLAAKLQALLPRPMLPAVEQLLAAVDAPVPARAQPAPFLDDLIAAAQAGRWICVSYRSAERLSTIHLLPRQVTLRGGLWYCHAYAHEAGEDRTYRVDRVRALAPPEAGFVPAPAPPRRAYGDASHPEVVVTLTPRGAAALDTELDLDARPQPNPDGTLTVRFHCPPGELDWYARLFGGLGSEAVVQAPPALVQRLAALGQKLVEQYEKR
jgi:predicted DNA-binding transcriptional regulator YafY